MLAYKKTILNYFFITIEVVNIFPDISICLCHLKNYKTAAKVFAVCQLQKLNAH